MSNDWPYSDDELNRYFNDPGRRSTTPGAPPPAAPPPPDPEAQTFWSRTFDTPKKRQAAVLLGVLTGLVLLGTLGIFGYMASLKQYMPSTDQLENPNFQFATVAYTANGSELARFAKQNRAWVTYDEISPHAINALIATEDKRFHKHWGIDMFGIFVAAKETILELDPRGASTISMQLARNLFNEQIGRAVTPSRKLKEIATAVQLERLYTKNEIVEMYLNTVEFGNNAFGIEAAARTFYNKDPLELTELEAATLIGMLKATTAYNPVRNPERSKTRRNTVLLLMVNNGYLTREFYDAHKEEPVGAEFYSSAVTASVAPYFAEYVHNWVKEWCAENNCDVYTDGLTVYTTLDERIQQHAQQAVQRQMKGLQAVVDFEWSRASPARLADNTEAYLKRTNYEPFKYFWETKDETVDAFIRETPRFKRLRSRDVSAEEAMRQLQADEAFIDSLKAEKTRLEAGLVSIDPRNGHVKTWVGGRDLTVDWYDHVAVARRQPGSTFKPFVYTTAIDNGFSPYYLLRDSVYAYEVISDTDSVWAPTNSGPSTNRMMTLREALATSTNTVTAQLMMQVEPRNVVFYARRMGVTSPLAAVPALALGVSDVTLLEMTTAYATLASGGLRRDPIVVTRIEDRHGNVLFEVEPTPEEALSQQTAYTMVDMLRGTIQQSGGTGVRIRYQFGLGDYDLAGKTGTTQNSADGWFMMMHPELVTGAWVGFNDRRVAFRTDWWGQGAHNALFLVGDYFKSMTEAQDTLVRNVRFPAPEEYGLELPTPDTPEDGPATRPRRRW